MPEDAPTYQHILYERRDRVGLITLNRPGKLNAWTSLMETEFIDAVNHGAGDSQIGALVVTGAGRGFCSGADISAFAGEMTGGGRALSPAPFVQGGSPEVPIALTRGKPVIAAINGPSVGVGLTMTLACDIRIASERATFSARFVKMGLTPECGSTRYLPLVAGLSNALYLALTGRIVDATEAKERGLIDRIVPHDSLMDEAMSLAEEIAANPTRAAWGAKRLLHENATEANLRRVVTEECFSVHELQLQPDHAEAVRAFVEKRPPKFHG